MTFLLLFHSARRQLSSPSPSFVTRHHLHHRYHLYRRYAHCSRCSRLSFSTAFLFNLFWNNLRHSMNSENNLHLCVRWSRFPPRLYTFFPYFFFAQNSLMNAHKKRLWRIYLELVHPSLSRLRHAPRKTRNPIECRHFIQFHLAAACILRQTSQIEIGRTLSRFTSRDASTVVGQL